MSSEPGPEHVVASARVAAAAHVSSISVGRGAVQPGCLTTTQRSQHRNRVGSQGFGGDLMCCLLDVVAGGPAAEREPQRGPCPARVVSHGQQYGRGLRRRGMAGCTGRRGDAWNGGQQVISGYSGDAD